MSAPVADLLTVELSAKPHLQVLERAQIEKVYREQQLSAVNRDYVKLGQVLGAEGLLLLGATAEGTNKFVIVRLVAVKPGVIIGNVRTPWPVPDAANWAHWVANHFAPLLPKLGVAAKDAIPISVVNFRSAVRSVEAQELERQLTVLTIDRLTRERELFVLERRRMDLLTGEKELQGVGESAFWNGSYLLDGTIDRDGYSKDRATLNARLVPPGNGVRVDVDLASVRTNLTSLVEALARKILANVQRTNSAPEWSPAAEAAKYFEEANWALKWRMFEEAQTAAESAWALGKQDLDCAIVRVRAYLATTPSNVGRLFKSEISGAFERRYAANEVAGELADLLNGRPFLRFISRQRGGVIELSYVLEMPDPLSIDRATHTLALYRDFCRTLPEDKPKSGTAWYCLGLEALGVSSQILQQFHFLLESQTRVAEKLATLRAEARSVAAWLSHSSSVRNNYFVRERVMTPDELYHSFQEATNIFRCKLDWGCFWFDRPEDTVSQYEELMDTPVYAYLHKSLWFRPLERPRLAAWTEQDRRRLPAVWNEFLRKLDDGTNIMLRVEGKCLEFMEATSDQETEKAFQTLFDTIMSNREAVVTNSFVLPSLELHLSELIESVCATTESRLKRKLRQRYISEYKPGLDAMSQAYSNYREEVLAKQSKLAQFESQKRYLADQTPYSWISFNRAFRFRDYSKEQAVELLPLLAGYKSNLAAQADGKVGVNKARATTGMGEVAGLEHVLNQVISSPPQPVQGQPTTPPAKRPPRQIANRRSPTDCAPPRMKALLVNRFVKIPQDRLWEHRPEEQLTQLKIVASRVQQGQLWLDLRYIHTYGDFSGSRVRFVTSFRSTAASWDMQNGAWDLLQYPEPTNVPDWKNREFFEIFNGDLYVSGSCYLRRCDLKTRQWTSLEVPWQEYTRLLTSGPRLYAINDQAVLEIAEDGKRIRILASCRRRPAITVLDSLADLRGANFFPGPLGSLGVTIDNKVLWWDDQNWKEALVFAWPIQTLVTEDAVLLCGISPYNKPMELWLLPREQTTAELCWSEAQPAAGATRHDTRSLTMPADAAPQRPRWPSLGGAVPLKAATTTMQSNLYFYVERFSWTNVPGQLSAVVEQDGRHADLVCLDRQSTRPIVIPLRFDLSQGPLPFNQTPPDGNVFLCFSSDFLFIGKPAILGSWVVSKSDLDAVIARERARLTVPSPPVATQPKSQP